MNNKNIYIIILNWNGTDDTIECIESLLKVNYDNYQLILVDNNSEEKNYNYLREWCDNTFPLVLTYSQQEAEQGGIEKTEKLHNSKKSKEKLLVIKNDDNLGFAAGNNVALRYVLSKQEEGNYSLLLNNDTVVESDFLTHLATFMDEHPNYVAATPQIRYFEPKDIIWNCGGKILWFGNRRYHYAKSHISKVPQKGFKNITYITGCALFFKPQIAGILTDKFFFGEEDLDFSFRQKIAKRKIACVFDSVIYHKVNASVSKVSEKLLGKVYLFYLMRFINNRQYSSKLMFLVKVYVNLSYAIPMIKLRYGASFGQIFRLIKKLFVALKTLDSLDREYTLMCLKQDFTK